jgi:hypothetical protein
MIVAAVFAWAFGAVPAEAQKIKVDPQQSKLLLAASSTATLRQELEQAGALGFHAIMATTRGTGETVLLLERNIKTPEKLQYLLIATNTTGTFRKEISEAAQQGYRVAPGTFLNKPPGPFNEIVLVMKRPAGTTKAIYEYDLLSTDQTSRLHSEWVVSTTQGYRAVGFIHRFAKITHAA